MLVWQNETNKSPRLSGRSVFTLLGSYHDHHGNISRSLYEMALWTGFYILANSAQNLCIYLYRQQNYRQAFREIIGLDTISTEVTPHKTQLKGKVRCAKSLSKLLKLVPCKNVTRAIRSCLFRDLENAILDMTCYDIAIVNKRVRPYQVLCSPITFSML